MVVMLAAVSALAGCGSDATFTAEELIAAVNEHGGGLELGEPLAASEDGDEIHTLTFTGTVAERPADVHAGGSLMITDGDDAALDQYRRCEAAASLVCFRAANAVLLFEGSVPAEDLARLERAIRALASE